MNYYPGMGLGVLGPLAFQLGFPFVRVRIKVVPGGGFGLFGKQLLGLVDVEFVIEISFRDKVCRKTFTLKRLPVLHVFLSLSSVLHSLHKRKKDDVTVTVSYGGIRLWRK